MTSAISRSDLKQILSIRTGEPSQIAKRPARSAAVPAFDHRRGRRILWKIKDDAKRIAIDIDEFEPARGENFLALGRSVVRH
jgi:hypothetical protein